MKDWRQISDNAIEVDVRRPTPLTDPIAIRDAAKAEYRAKLKAAGREVSEPALDRFVVQELNIVDAFGRDAQLRAAPRRTVPRRDLDGDMAKLGLKLYKGDHDAPDKVYDHHAATRTPAHQMGELVSMAVARIGRILQGDQGTGVADIDQAIAGTSVPKLAREFLELWWYYTNRGQPSRFNPFVGLDDVDASRKIIRGMFDICDRSTGIPWLRNWKWK